MNRRGFFGRLLAGMAFLGLGGGAKAVPLPLPVEDFSDVEAFIAMMHNHTHDGTLCKTQAWVSREFHHRYWRFCVNDRIVINTCVLEDGGIATVTHWGVPVRVGRSQGWSVISQRTDSSMRRYDWGSKK